MKNEISSTEEQFSEARSILQSSVDDLASLEQQHAQAKVSSFVNYIVNITGTFDGV